MLSTLAHNWWMIALRGIAAVLFGVAVLLYPQITLKGLVVLFGAFTLADGVLALAASITNRFGEMRGWVLGQGIAGTIAGVVILMLPGMTPTVLLYLVAAWAIITGFAGMMAAIDVRQELENEWFLALSGIATLIFGVLIGLQTEAGALAMTWLIGLYGIVFGISLLLFSFRLRVVNERIERRTAHST